MQVDNTKDYRDLASDVIEALGEGAFTKRTILRAVSKDKSVSYWWPKVRRGFSQLGAYLGEVGGAGSGNWRIALSLQAEDAVSILEENAALHSMWHRNLDEDVQTLLGTVEDAEALMIQVVDRGYDPFKLLYLAAANGTPEDKLHAMARVLISDDVRAAITDIAQERHTRIMGLLSPPTD